MRQNDRSVAVIGAGPIGLYFASLCEERGVRCEIFEASQEAGGQLTHLYPEKPIENIPGEQKIKAYDYVRRLLKRLRKTKINYNSKIAHAGRLANKFDYVVDATGAGEYRPNRLGVAGDDRPNIIYSIKDPSKLHGKRVVIFGGGDSAIDWAARLSKSANVTLIHRREEFRGDASALDSSRAVVLRPYVPAVVERDYVAIKSVKTCGLVKLPYDVIVVCFGCSASKSQPQGCERIIRIGDAAGGAKTIAAGIESAERAMASIMAEAGR